jgi:hypothetical protein
LPCSLKGLQSQFIESSQLDAVGTASVLIAFNLGITP